MIKNKLSHHTLKCLIDFFFEYKHYQSSYRVILALVVIKRCFHCPLRSTRHTFGTRYFLWSSWWRQVIIFSLTQTHLTTFHLLPDGRMSVKHVILWATILNNLDLTDMKLRSLTWYFLLVSPQESNGSILQKLMWAIQPEPEESEAPTSNHFTFLLLWFFIRPSVYVFSDVFPSFVPVVLSRHQMFCLLWSSLLWCHRYLTYHKSPCWLWFPARICSRNSPKEIK